MKKAITLLLASVCTVISVKAQEFQMIDINPSGGSWSQEFTEYNGKLYFSAFDGNGAMVSELWVTDGTETGTQKINPTGMYFPSKFTVLNNKLYFEAATDTHGFELWVTDGTEAGTQMVKDIFPGTFSSSIESLTVFNGKLYFSAEDNINTGSELWVSDGTSAGTQMLKNINPNGGSYPTGLTEYNGKLYFYADDDTNGYELWVTDGTTAGTQMLKDINPSGDSFPTLFTEYNNKLYFTANNGTNGRELWVTDGTSSGTQMLKDINPSGSSDIYEFKVYSGKLYFPADNGANGVELWVTDGTTTGTQMLVDVTDFVVNGVPYSTYPQKLTEYNGKLYFNAGLGRSLYVTDGTVTGTEEVKHINTTTSPTQDPISGSIENLIVYDGKLYFRANDNTNGLELWVSDGTPAGTQKIIPEIAPNTNPLQSNPYFTVFQNSLYFSANYNSSGPELWKLTTNNLSVQEMKQAGFSLYPNPSNDRVYLTSTEIINNVTIFDLAGKMVYQQNFDSNEVKIDISDLPQALYLVKITTDKQVKTIKFSKS